MDTYEAVQEWGRLKLQEAYPRAKIKRQSVDVYLDTDSDYDYDSPERAVVCVSSGKFTRIIEGYDFNLVQFVNEVNEISYQRSEK